MGDSGLGDSGARRLGGQETRGTGPKVGATMEQRAGGGQG